MRAEDVMTTRVVSTRPDAEIREATALVLQHRVAALPVLDDDDRLVGIVSELDLLRERVPPDPRAHARPVARPDAAVPRTVGEVMTREVHAVPVGTDAAQVAALLATSGVKSVPVVRGEHLVGIIGRRDLLRRLHRSDAAVADDVRQALAQDEDYLGRWTVEVTGGQVRLSGGPDNRSEPAVTVASTVDGVLRVQAE